MVTRYIGIVGHESAKFTELGEQRARALIRYLLSLGEHIVVSGGCHLGGIDIWAEEESRAMGREPIVFKPTRLQWSGDGGFEFRNNQIAMKSDEVHSLVVDALPATYTGMRFKLCYHCNKTDHVKSGGCWTAKRARLLGKPGLIHVIRNDGV